MFDLLLSPDAKYLVYSRPGCGYAGESLFDLEEYNSQDETGLYVLNMQSNETTKLPLKWTDQLLDQIPICWFEVPWELDTSPFNIVLDKKKSHNITHINSSSKLITNGTSYPSKYAFDGLKETAWVEGAEGNGENEWIKTEQRYTIVPSLESAQCYETEQTLFGIKIINGYAKTKQTYFNNNRVKK